MEPLSVAARWAAVASACWAADEILRLTAGGGTPLFRPSAGIAAAALLIAGRRVWPGVLPGLAASAVVGSAGPPGFAALVEIAFRSAGVAAAAALMARVRTDCRISAGTCPALGAVLGAAAAGSAAAAGAAAVGADPRSVGFAEAAGVLYAAPFVLTLFGGPPWSIRRPDAGVAEAVATAAATAGVAALLLASGPLGLPEPPAAMVLVAPTWAAVRFGLAGASVATLLIGLLWAVGAPPTHDGVAVIVAGQILLFGGLAGRVWAEHEALTESRTRFALLADHLRAGFWIWDLDRRRLEYVSPAYQAITGRPAAELTADPAGFLRHVPAEDQPALERLIAGPAAGLAAEVDFRYRAPDGRLLWLRCRSYPVRDADGRVAKVVGVGEDVTEFKHAQEDRRRFFDASADLLFILEPDDRIREVNPAVGRTLGWQAEDMRGRAWTEFVHPDDLAGAEEAGDTLRSAGSLLGFECRFRTADGDWRILRWTSVAGRGDGLVYSNARDVTDRRRMEAELRAEKEFLQTVLDNAPVLITVIQDLRPVYFNRSAARAFAGLEGPAADGNLLKAAHPDPRRLEEAYRHVRAADGTWRDFEVRTAPGEVRRQSWANVRLSDGRVVGIGLDITDRVRAEQALADSERRFRALVHSAADVIVVVAPDGRLSYVSPAVQATLGLQPEDLLGRDGLGRVHPDDAAAVRQGLADCLTHPGEPRTGQFRLQRPDGGWRDFEAVARNLVGDPAVGGVVVNLRDVTERRRIEEHLREAAKMQAVGRLARGIAHEFNSLLMAAMIHAGMIRRALPESDPLRRDAEQIGKAVERAAALTRQLQAFGRRQMLHPEPLDLAEVIDEGLGLLQRVVGEAVTVRWDCHAPVGRVRADRGQIEQVLLSLAGRARQLMPAGGSLALRLEEADAPPEWAGRRDRPAGRCAVLAVTDDGPAPGPAELERMFEPFAGSGDFDRVSLELAAVHGIIVQSGGHIEAGAGPGGGTAFRIWLPLWPGEPGDGPPPPAQPPL
jgi:PAS domain S-box-containing protein